MVTAARLLPVAVCAALLASCEPALEDDSSTIASSRVLAIQVEPPEAAPGDPITMRALVASPDDASHPTLAWRFCLDRRALTDLDSVTASCVGDHGTFVDLGAGALVMATVPSNACRLFGPDAPDPLPGQPPGRPVDPDVTGGYFQPVTVALGSPPTVAGVRLACGLAGARREDSVVYTAHARVNANPQVTQIFVNGVATSLDESAPPVPVARGAQIALAVQFPACARTAVCGDGVCSPEETTDDCAADCASPSGCGGEETYLYYDAPGLRIAVRREGMRASWFSTGGAFADAHVGNAEGEAEANRLGASFAAPATSGVVRIWVVLRDDRGGIGWATLRLGVQ